MLPPQQMIDEQQMRQLVSDEIGKSMQSILSELKSIPGEVVEHKQIEPSKEWLEERRQLKRWYKTRGVGADISQFSANYLTGEDKAAVIAEVCAADVWESY
jgi:hypothetical protein